MEILGVEKLTDEKWLNLYAAWFSHNDHTGRWVFATRKPAPYQGHQADAVIIVPVLRDPGREPLLVVEKEFRVPVGDYVIGFPAGLIDDGESLEDSVRREMLEETGFEVVRFKRVTGPLYSSGGMTDESAAMAFVDCRSLPGGGPKPERSEDIEVLLLDYAGVCRLCDSRDARLDAKAWTALYMYQQLGALV